MFYYTNHKVVSESFLRKTGVAAGDELTAGYYPIDYESGKAGLGEYQDAREDIDLGILENNRFIMGYEFIDKPVDVVRGLIIEKLSSIRSSKERGGIVYFGVPIDTSQESQILLMGMNNEAQNNPDITASFTANDGQPVTADAATIQGIYSALFDFIRGCREHQASIVSNSILPATTVSELAAVDLEAGWPTGIYN